MPFYIYEIQGSMCVQLRGQSLLPVLKDFAGKEAERGSRRWHARKEDLLRGMEVEPWENHAVIVDLKPDTAQNVSLFEVEDVWGVSDKTWTPLALRLRPLFVDIEEKDKDGFKKAFPMPSAEAIRENGGAIHEFLYALHKEGVGGPWRWGRNGVVNATLLWPEVFEYFVLSIQARTSGDTIPAAAVA